jgi:electron transport complex protein RnfE
MNKLRRERDLIMALALFPLLSAVTSFSSSLLMCAITAAIYACTLLATNYTRKLNNSSHGLLITILVATAVGGLIDLCLQAFVWKASASLATYLPFVVVSVVFVVSNEDVPRLSWGRIVKFFAAMIGFGALRELIGMSALFGQLEMLLGDHAGSWRIGLTATDRGFLLALLPVGALIAIGLMIAVKNYFFNPVEPDATATATTRRVRVTGPVS